MTSDRAVEPRLGDVLRRARKHRGYSLREVQDRTGILNAHLSQIERGQIRRPDPSLLWRLCELYLLDYGQLAHWAGHASGAGDSSAQLAVAVRMLGDLSSSQISEVLRVIDRLRREGERGIDPS